MQISNRIRTETLIKLFNQKIETVSKERPDIAEIQPLKRTKKYLANFNKLTEGERKRARATMFAYLQEGAEEQSTKYGSLTKWGEKMSESFVKRVNKQKAVYYKTPMIADIEYSIFKPQFEKMKPSQAKKAVWALEQQSQTDIHMSPELYKANYLEAIANEFGIGGGLYTYVEQLPADILVAAYKTDPAIFEIKYIYSQDEKGAQQAFLYEKFEEYVAKHTNYVYKNPFEVDEDEFEDFTV